MWLGELKRYEKYKDSGVEWIGEVPVDWTISKIKYSTYVKGRIGWQGLRADEFIDEGPFLVTGTDFMNGEINWDTCYHVSLERYNEAPAIQLKEGDLLITKDGTIGKVAIVYNKPEKAILNSGIFVTRALGDRYFSKYMYWLLNSCIFNIYIDFTKTGSTIVHLYQETFEDFSFPLPSIKDQKQIIDFLDQKTSEIDSLIADKEKLIELLQEQRQAIISEAVTKGLDRNVKMKDSGIEWIGEVPEEWDLKRFSYCVSITNGQVNPKEDPFLNMILIAPNHIESGSGNIVYTETAFEQGAESGKYYCNSGDVIYSKIRPELRKACIAKTNCLCSADMYPMRTNKKVLLEEYLLWLLLSDNFTQFAILESMRVAMPKINRESLSAIKLPLPPIEEQKKILKYIESNVSSINQLINSILIQIYTLKEYRQSLISEAVTGKIMV